MHITAINRKSLIPERISFKLTSSKANKMSGCIWYPCRGFNPTEWFLVIPWKGLHEINVVFVDEDCICVTLSPVE